MSESPRPAEDRAAAAPEARTTLAHFEPTIPPEPPRAGGKPYVVWSSSPADAATSGENRED